MSEIKTHAIDTTLSQAILGPLKSFASHPQCTIEADVMNEIIWAFEYAADYYESKESAYLRDKLLDRRFNDKVTASRYEEVKRQDEARMTRGLVMFAEHFQDLWL